MSFYVFQGLASGTKKVNPEVNKDKRTYPSARSKRFTERNKKKDTKIYEKFQKDYEKTNEKPTFRKNK
jgi:uncharacterized protein YtpQ (UPF0354 family)